MPDEKTTGRDDVIFRKRAGPLCFRLSATGDGGHPGGKKEVEHTRGRPTVEKKRELIEQKLAAGDYCAGCE